MLSKFSSWVKKYRKEHGQPKPSRKKSVKAFIPVEVPKTMEAPVLGNGQIDITYPNGVKVSCPESIEIHQLKTLISL